MRFNFIRQRKSKNILQKIKKFQKFMQHKNTISSIRVKLKKYSSDSKFKFTQHHSLNKSPTKNVPSLNTGSLRFLQPKSDTPNKFYNIPESKSKKSASFGFGTKTNFVKKNFIEPTRYRIASSFDLRSRNKQSTSFGISRQEFYKGKLIPATNSIGPGCYNLKQLKLKNTFYMGIKINRKDQSVSPGPGTYNISQMQTVSGDNTANTTILKLKAPRLKTQYFQKNLLQRYDTKTPGPGACTYLLKEDELSSSNSLSLLKKFRGKKPKLPQCNRFKVREQNFPSPGNYQLFSQFG